ncbi:hypothetical protein SAMN02745164_00763 [Marinitoga hydrogenitolerans DSM 16785]|uniref:Uncharacterized protein n=1 Tax=Marinitoga hydrogenitolerans (strain DSM 16785 / JCM 12826 / AT1271) TaxID=1122195 RepID=A0A1M4USS5_MARH1|nr:hypothetical protein [Marinitoga hydrogenitolerans]SHE59776.1 hypothetical protein SAMN02745164_00763 [Marinitoga hydrogenitolerans DSM 16785]
MKRPIFVVFLSLIYIILFSEQAIYNISEKAYVENTKHFKFIFEKDLYADYKKLKGISEKLYEDYRDFYETDPGSITVFIFDDVDFVNAFAVPPLNIIRLYINAPFAKYGLTMNVENWIEFVFSHELNHIFYGNMLSKYVSWIPNKEIKKAAMLNWQPSYLHEGLSIYMESKYFKGRFQSDLFNMYLRAEILGKDYPRYKLGSSPQSEVWSPAGFNYMYGAIFTKEIAEKYGEETLKKIIIEINSHLFFITISTAFEKITGEKWEDFLLYIRVKYKNQYIDLLNKEYIDSYDRLDDSYHFTSNIKTDGKNIYYYKQSPNNRSGIYRNNKLIIPDIRSFDISQDGKIIYLVSNQNEKNINSLYLKCHCPISDTLIDKRVITFSFADKDNIVYTKINKGLTAIFMKNIITGKKEKILDYGKYTINDFYYSKGKIFFSGIMNNQNDIFYIDLKTKKIKQLTEDKYIEMNIFVKDDLLYYSANYEDNIFNIYSMNLENNEVNKLTNHIYGAFYPVVLNNDLYFLFYDSEGYHLSKKNVEKTKIKNIKTVNKTINIKNEIMIPEHLEIYNEPLKYSFIFPYIENEKYGIGYISLSEGLNYGIGGAILTDFNTITPIIGFYLNKYTENFVRLDYTNSKLYTNINVSKRFEFFMKRKNYLLINTNLEIENLDIINKSIAMILVKNPYKINTQNYYESSTLMGYKNDNYFIQQSTTFDLLSLKTEPYLYYDTSGNLIPGVKISKKIWYPYFYVLDGKYGFDGISGNIDYNYNLKTKSYKFSLSLKIELTTFYWLKIPLPIPIY